ncbi:MAG: hypothetical protein ACXVAM_16530 [Vulcanimicrobiaceae bacterium]
MKFQRVAACALLVLFVPLAADAGGRGGGGFSRGSVQRPSGGFDFHNDGGASHSSTGPAGTSRTTNVSNTGSGYGRSTTASNGNASRTTTGGASNGTYNKSSTASNGYGTHSTSASANRNSGNYSRSTSGSNPYGSYNSNASGNAYNHTYNRTTNATNAYGQSYHGSTTANNGYVSHGAYVTNPVYGGYPAWGWNAGVAWYPAPYYYGGGFWGAMAIGATSAAVYGSIVNANNQTVTSYQVQPDSPGAKLLSSYQLTQTPCGPPNLVVIYGPNSSVICAHPNNLVSAGTYTVNSSNLTIVSQKS